MKKMLFSLLFLLMFITPCFAYSNMTVKIEGSTGSGENIASIDTEGFIRTTPACSNLSRITSTVTALVVKNAPGIIHAVIVGTRGDKSRIVLWDNATASSGNLIASLDAASATQTYIMDSIFKNGLTVDVSAYADVVSKNADIVLCTT